MKLRDLHEGIGFRSNLTRSEIEAVPQGQLSTILGRNGRFVFRDTDQPEDFIKLEPLQKAQKLNVVPENQDSLSTFQGSHIYYAYRIAESDSIDLPQTQAPENNDELITQVAQIGKFDTEEQMKRAISYRQAQLRRKDLHMEQDHINVVKQEIDILNQMREILNSNSVTSITKLRSLDNKARTANDKFKQRVLRNLRVALGHAIKDPRGRREQTLQRRIIDECVNQYIRKVDVIYELVLYPTSESDFGKQLAEAFASQYGGTAQMIPKALGKEASISTSELQIRAKRIQQKVMAGIYNPYLLNRMMILPKHQKWIKSITIPTSGVLSTDRRWPDLWAEKEATKLDERLKLSAKPDEIPRAKSNEMGDKRRYAQLFKLPPEVIAEGLEILIVDDNVHHSGTMETIHQLVSSGLAPKRVDMFVPFWFRYPE